MNAKTETSAFLTRFQTPINVVSEIKKMLVGILNMHTAYDIYIKYIQGQVNVNTLKGDRLSQYTLQCLGGSGV